MKFLLLIYYIKKMFNLSGRGEEQMHKFTNKKFKKKMLWNKNKNNNLQSMNQFKKTIENNQKSVDSCFDNCQWKFFAFIPIKWFYIQRIDKHTKFLFIVSCTTPKQLRQKSTFTNFLIFLFYFCLFFTLAFRADQEVNNKKMYTHTVRIKDSFKWTYNRKKVTTINWN